MIAQIQQLKKQESALAHHIFSYINLNPFAAALQMREPRLSHQTVGNDAPGHAHFLFVRFQIGRLRRLIEPDQIGGCVAPAKFSRKCFKSKSLYLLQFFLALFELVTRLELQVKVPSLSGCKRSIKAAGWLRQGTPRTAIERPVPVLVHKIICYRFLKVLLYFFNSSTRPAEVYSAYRFFSSTCRLRV